MAEKHSQDDARLVTAAKLAAGAPTDATAASAGWILRRAFDAILAAPMPTPSDSAAASVIGNTRGGVALSAAKLLAAHDLHLAGDVLAECAVGALSGVSLMTAEKVEEANGDQTKRKSATKSETPNLLAEAIEQCVEAATLSQSNAAQTALLRAAGWGKQRLIVDLGRDDKIAMRTVATLARGALTVRLLNTLRSAEGAMPLTARQLALVDVATVISRLAARRQHALALALVGAVQRGSEQGETVMHPEEATKLRDRVLLHWALERVWIAGLEAPSEPQSSAGDVARDGGGAPPSAVAEARAAALASALGFDSGIGRAAGAAVAALAAKRDALLGNAFGALEGDEAAIGVLDDLGQRIGNAADDHELYKLIVGRLRGTVGVPFAEIAAAASQAGRRTLATLLIRLEPRLTDQVRALVEMKELSLALQKAIEGSDGACVFSI